MSQSEMSPFQPPFEPGPVMPSKGGYGDPVSFSEAEKAYGAAVVLRCEVEAMVNKGRSFYFYRPVSFQVQLGDGMNLKIQVDVGEPSPVMPIEPPAILHQTVEMTVHWGPPPAFPVLKGAKIIKK